MFTDLIGHVGHQVHVVRWREARTLLRWAGDLDGRRLLDVAGGDGYWAAMARRRGAEAFALDIARPKLLRGKQFRHAPHIVEGNALQLPFDDATFDVVLSICAIEHFDDGPTAIAEMARVLRPGGTLVMSADTLARSARWPALDAEHRRRYHVQTTYDHGRLGALFADSGLALEQHTYLFRSATAEHLYLGLSAKGGRAGWNIAAPLSPVVAVADRLSPDQQGSVVLVRARKAAA